jgi:flagellar basal-body rod modification protein FlgD
MSSIASIAGVSNLGETSSNVASSPTTPTSGLGTQLDKDTFLKLLVAQLKYQDPSKPADASAFISQSAQLAVVDKLDTMTATLNRTGLATRLDLAANLVGKSVSYAGKDGVVTSAVVRSVRFDGTDTSLDLGTVTIPLDAALGISTSNTNL